MNKIIKTYDFNKPFLNMHLVLSHKSYFHPYIVAPLPNWPSVGDFSDGLIHSIGSLPVRGPYQLLGQDLHPFARGAGASVVN